VAQVVAQATEAQQPRAPATAPASRTGGTE
jgi:hypothetical protein